MSSNDNTKPKPLLAAAPSVINIGLERFADELKARGTPTVHLDWVPPARGNAALARLLSKLGS